MANSSNAASKAVRSGALLIVCLAVIAYALWPKADAPQTDTEATSNTVATELSSEQEAPQQTLEASPAATLEAEIDEALDNGATVDGTSKLPPPTFNPITAASAGHYPWTTALEAVSDELFYILVNFLRTDPEFLDGIKAEFLAERDPKRLERLAFLLGETKDISLTAVAAEMINSGVPESEKAALSLLGRLQQHDETARSHILQVISTRTETPTLIDAMNALAHADKGANTAQKRTVTNHITPLLQHPEAAVRRHGYSILFRWAGDMPDLEPQLLSALEDPDPRVRRSGAYGFMDVQPKSHTAKHALLWMMDNPNESLRNRKAAALSLQQYDLHSDEEQRIKAVRMMR